MKAKLVAALTGLPLVAVLSVSSLAAQPRRAAQAMRSVSPPVVAVSAPPTTAPARIVLVPSFAFGWDWSPFYYPYPPAYRPVQVIPGDRFPVELHIHPRKAEVVVDGKDLGEARRYGSVGSPLWLTPGQHDLTIRYPAYQRLETKIEVAPTLNQDFSFRLDRVEGA